MLFFDQKQHEGVGLEEFRTLRSRLYQIRTVLHQDIADRKRAARGREEFSRR